MRNFGFMLNLGLYDNRTDAPHARDPCLTNRARALPFGDRPRLAPVTDAYFRGFDM